MAGYSVTFTVVDNATKQIDQINRRIAAMHAPIERMSRSVQKFIDVSGLRKIADGFNWIGRAASGVLRSLTAIVPVLGAITGAATITGMVKLVSSFAQWGNQLKTNADQIGITADELQKFQDATTRAGGNAEDMTETLKELHKISADAFTGMNRDAMAYFKRFNIDLTDANGHLKSATQLLPEVFHALDSLKDPADRSRVAAAMLGDAQAKLYEEYKQSGKPLEDWLREEENHKRLTEAQLEQLNRYRLAQASLGTTFDQLGRQIAAVLANNFTPFLQHLDDFVQKHQPEIIAAIDNISAKFAAWLEKPETWKAFEDGAKAVIDALVWITTHLDEIKTAAEVIAGIFATKWALGIVASIAQVTAALGSAGAGVAGAAGVAGVGLAGALAGIAAIVATLALGAHYETPETRKEREELRKSQGTGLSPTTLPTSDFWVDSQGRKHDATTGEILQEHSANTNPAPSNRFAGPGALAPDANAPPPGASDAGTFLANRFARNAPGSTAGPPPGTTNAQPGKPVGVAEQQENLRRAMDEQGVTDPSMRAGIAAISAGEGGFKPRSEEGYGPTIDKRGAGYVRGIFGARVGDLNDQQLTALAHNDEAFFNKVYGGRLGNAPDEGYKYRGRGDFQLTGKGNYERYGKMIGVDLVSNPDLVNDPAISAKIAVAYMKDRYHGGGFEGMKRAVGNPVEATERTKDAAYAEYLRTGQFAGPAQPQVAQAQQPPGATAAPPPVAPPVQAPPVAPPAAAPPVNGSVSVDITHRNPPPDASVTAQGTGAVDVAPPRIERPQLAFTTA